MYATVAVVGLVKGIAMLRIAATTGRLALSGIINLLTKGGPETTLAATRQAGTAAAAAMQAAELSLAATRKGVAAATGAAGIVSTTGNIAASSRMVLPTPTVPWGTAVKDVNALGRTAGAASKTAATASSAAGAASRLGGKAAGLAALGPWGAALGVVDVLSGFTNTVFGIGQRHNTNVRLDAIYRLLQQRIPLNFSDIAFNRPNVVANAGGYRQVTFEKGAVVVRVEYLGQSHDELVETVSKRLTNELQTLLT